MAEYLVIGGKSDDAVLCALAVSADIAAKTDAQIDIATSPSRAAIARLGKTPRRIVEADIATPAVPGISWNAIRNAPAGGWKGMLSFAQKTARNAASTAREQFGQYRELAEELRLVRYDAVLDLDGDAAGLLVARIANAAKMCGFAAENLPDAAPGASLLYHDSRLVPRNLPRREQCRRLAAACLGYTPAPRPEWNFIDPPPLANAPPPPFLLAGGNIPGPFMEVLRAAGAPLFFADSPAEMLAAARIAECAVGDGIAVSIAAAADARALFIGVAKQAPPEATATESPDAMRSALADILRRAPTTDPATSAAQPTQSAEIKAADEPATPAHNADARGGGLRIKR